MYDHCTEEAATAGFHDYPAEPLRKWYNMIDMTRRGITTFTFNEREDVGDKNKLSNFAFDLLNTYDPEDEDDAGAFHVVAYIFSLIFTPDVEGFENM